MSEQDKSLLDEQASLVRAVYRALPEEEIPAELERRILENAAAAIKPSGAGGARRWLQWSAPFASAAVVLLVVAVVMQPQSQHEMVPQEVMKSDSRQAVPPPAANEPVASSELSGAPAVPRLPAEKPDLSASSKALEDVRVQSREDRAMAYSAPPPKSEITTSTISGEMSKRKESIGAASEPSLAMAEERDGLEEKQSAAADAPESAGALSPADNRLSFSNRAGFTRAAPAAAVTTRANPALNVLDISPELRARLEKLSSARKKIDGSADAAALDSTLEQLRHEYPGVDIDAALQALERTRVEGAE